MVEMEGELEARNFGDDWRVDIPSDWKLQPTQLWVHNWLGPLADTRIVSGGWMVDSVVMNADEVMLSVQPRTVSCRPMVKRSLTFLVNPPIFHFM